MVCSSISPRYVGKLNNARNSRQNNRINNVETAETTDQSTSQETQNVNYINYNEQFISDYDSSDDNYVPTVENVRSPPIALQNMMITIGNTDCHLLLDSGSGCTIINMSQLSIMVGEKTIRIKVFF